MKDIEIWLLKKYSPRTVKMYMRDIGIFFSFIGKEKAQSALYRDIMAYVEYLRRRGTGPSTISRTLYGVRAWYNYLLETGRRNDHPCRWITLKDARGADIQIQDLFTKAELELLMERTERFESVRIRNKAVVSLLIYQGLRLKEITALEVGDIDLPSSSIRVKEMPKTNGRTLPLKPSQVMLFSSYINEVRPGLIKENTDNLLLNIRGGAMTADDISYLLGTFKHHFPGRLLSAKTIRQSVIANLLKAGHDLRVVQAFAGHKKVSSTERYRQTGLEALRAAILKYHPLSGDGLNGCHKL